MRVLNTRAIGQLLSDDISSGSHEVVVLSRKDLDVVDPKLVEREDTSASINAQHNL